MTDKSSPAPARSAEPTAAVGPLRVTLLNSGGVLFKVVGAGWAVGGQSLSPLADPVTVAHALVTLAKQITPNQKGPLLKAVEAAMPGPSAPVADSLPPRTLPLPSRAACLGNLTAEATPDGFDLVVNAARTNRTPIRASFKWGMENDIAAKTLRSAANSLCPQALPSIKPGEIVTNDDTPGFSPSKLDRAFEAAEWQFVASSFGLARAALKQAGYPDQQFEGAQVLAASKADEFRRMGGK